MDKLPLVAALILCGGRAAWTGPQESQTIRGLEVAVRPVCDAKQVKGYFGTDLRAKGVLPVLVTVKNGSADQSFILLKDEFRLADADAGEGSKPAGRMVSGQSRSGDALVGVGSLTVMPALTIIGVKRIANATAVKERIVKNELRNQTLSPGESREGFVYFTVASEKEFTGRLRVKAMTVPANETLEFQFDLSWR